MLDCVTLDASNTIICQPNSRQNNRLEEEMYVSKHLTITSVILVAANNLPLTKHYILHSSVVGMECFSENVTLTNRISGAY